jgi:hypothetical protein
MAERRRRGGPPRSAAEGEAGEVVVLKVLSEDFSAVRRFHLGPGEHVVGSDPEAAVPLDDKRVSRRHATLEVLEEGGVVLTDLESRNGTFLHGRRIHRTALRGVAVLAFGPVHAVLKPADAARAQVLLGGAADLAGDEPPRGGRRGSAPASSRRAALAERDQRPTSYGLYPLGRLAQCLRELMPRLLAGESSPEATAESLAARLPTLLPVGRVELLRPAPGQGEALVAVASSGGPRPGDQVSLTVRGPRGWRLSLRAPDLEPLRPAEPLLALALELLALGEGEAASTAPAARHLSASPAEEARDRRGPHPPAAPPGLGPEMARVYRRCAKVARGDVPVLILGESGSGKEVLARWIHGQSKRAAAPLLAINCAALPRELLEAELFGIERGVATGVEARAGILERASGGTVFLDEIGDMAAELQAKVLRVLESTSLYRVGGRNPVSVDVRFLAATNRDLGAMVDGGVFRRDLYHRLAAFEALLPPLRQRRGEIPGLAARFFRREL